MDASVMSGLAAFRTESIQGMPPPEPIEMPVQDLRTAPRHRARWAPDSKTTMGRWIVFFGCAILTAYGTYQMVEVVEVGDITALQWAFIGLFAITFGWIALPCTGTLAGVLIRSRPLDPSNRNSPLRSLTALAMPVYNEDVAKTMASLEAMARALAAAGQAHAFEIVVLSDSTDPDIWVRETIGVRRLRNALQEIMPVWYRRRWKNTARKAGNIADFVSTWGGRYDHFIVLDADSIMSESALVRMAAAMERHARLGILQTAPVLAGGESVFARVQQFSSWIYGPVMAKGLTAWTGAEGNYWGHNAIIRTRAFAEACGLPDLRGKPPLGGPIMSHDFVEAALMRRAGWAVRLAPEIEGSYEEGPPSLLAAATRDRRWIQGNLQHAQVVGAAGLAWPSRVHLVVGIMSYLSSVLWLALLVTGLLLALQAHLIRPEYFAEDYQLFPTWPRFDAERMLALFVLTIGILFLPKMLGLALALADRRKRGQAGGGAMITAGAVLEVLLSALYAPAMMLMQSRYIYEILTGRDAGWRPQQRTARADSWGAVWQQHHWHFAIGIVATFLSYRLSPILFLWLSPTLLGLILVLPLSRLSSSVNLGRRLRAWGLLATESDWHTPEVVRVRNELIEGAASLPLDGLGYLAENPIEADAHVAFNLPAPPPVRGDPDVNMLTATQKLEDAKTRSEARMWLTRTELVRVASDRKLLLKFANLPASSISTTPVKSPDGK